MFDTIKRPSVPNDDPRLFKIKTGIVKAIKEAGQNGSPDRYFLEGIASSTVEDRHGDTITQIAQSQMLQAARDLTMWLNHSYNVPEDILGVCRESNLQAAVDNGQDCLDLVIRLEVYPDNPRAMKSWNAVQWGAQLGFSIGGAITDFEWVDEDDWWSALIINGLDLYEISLVGIPANPRAYTKFVEDIAGKMRSAAVAQAKDIIGKAASRDAAQLLLKKSLIGESVETRKELVVKQCAFADGCDKEAMEATDLCEEHAKALVVPDVKDLEPRCKSLGKEKINPTQDNPLDGSTYAKHVKATYAHPEKPTDVVLDVQVPANFDEAAFRVDFDAEVATFADECTYTLNITKDADGDNDGDTFPSADQCANIAQALKCINMAMQHVHVCSDSLKHSGIAHALIKSLLPQDYPYEDDPTDEPADPDDLQNSAHTELLKKFADLGNEIATKQTELETLSSTATQRAAEVTEAEKRIEALKAEETELQAKIDALKATPTGRQTAQAGGSQRGAAYTVRSQTMDQARKNLGAALIGQPQS